MPSIGAGCNDRATVDPLAHGFGADTEMPGGNRDGAESLRFFVNFCKFSFLVRWHFSKFLFQLWFIYQQFMRSSCSVWILEISEQM